MQEFVADAPVQPDAARHILHVTAQFLAQIGHLVDEGDLGGKKGVGRVFDQFRTFARGEDDRRLIQIKRAIDFAHHIARAFAVAAADHAIRPAEILDRRPLAQKFRVGGDIEIAVGRGFSNDLFHLAAGADRHGRFGDDHRITVDQPRHLFRRCKDILQVGMTIAAAAWRAHRDEHRVRPRHGLFQVIGEGKPPRLHIGGHHLVKTRLENRDHAFFQGVDLGLILVHADHVVTEFRQAGA